MCVYITLQILCVYAMTFSFFYFLNRIPVYVDMCICIYMGFLCFFLCSFSNSDLVLVYFILL